MPRETKLIDGVEVSGISREIQYAMEMLLPMVRAQKRIHDGKFNETDSEGVYNLYMLAYDDKELAEDAQLRALQTLVDQSCKRGTR